MRSPLASLGMFKRTKRKSWEFDGRAARRKQTGEIYNGPEIDISEYLVQQNAKTVKIKFIAKSGVYLFPDRREFPNKDISGAKEYARLKGFSILKLGGIKIRL